MDQEWMKRTSNIDFYFATLSAALDGLRREKILTDVILTTHDGTELPAHRIVLTSTCRYFRQQFTGPTANQVNILLPTAINAECMNIVLDFMYSGQVTLPQNLTETREIMRTAKLLDFELFHRYLASSLSTIIAPENFNALWDLADEFESEKLRNMVIAFVSKDLETFSNQKSFQDLRVDRLKLILQSPCVEINTAKCVLMTVIRWQSVNPRVRTLPMEDELLPLIKFSLIPKNVLEEVIKSEVAVQLSRKLWKIIASTLYARGKQVFGYRPKTDDDQYDSFNDDFKTCENPLIPKNEDDNPCVITAAVEDKLEEKFVAAEEDTNSFTTDKDGDDPAKTVGQNRPNLLNNVDKIQDNSNLALICPNIKPTAVKVMRAKSPRKRFTTSSPVKPETDTDQGLNIVIMGRKKAGEPAVHCFSLQTCTWANAVDVDEMLINNAAWTSHGNMMYLAGGMDCNHNVLSTVVVYNVQQNVFQVQDGRMNLARSSSSAATIGWHLYVVGGLGHHRKPLNSVEFYDILLDKWEVVQSLPYAGWDIGLAASEGKLWAMGGRAKFYNDFDGSEWILSCFSYDPELSQWTSIGHLPDEFSLAAPVITLYGKKIYALKHTSPSVMWSFELNSKRWHRLQLTNNSVLRRILAILPHDDRLWVIDYGGKMVMFNVQMGTWDREYPFSRTIAFPLYSVIANTKC